MDSKLTAAIDELVNAARDEGIRIGRGSMSPLATDIRTEKRAALEAAIEEYADAGAMRALIAQRTRDKAPSLTGADGEDDSE